MINPIAPVRASTFGRACPARRIPAAAVWSSNADSVRRPHQHAPTALVVPLDRLADGQLAVEAGETARHPDTVELIPGGHVDACTGHQRNLISSAAPITMRRNTRWDESRARSRSSPAPRAARAAATRCGWPRRAPTSSRSTSASRSRPCRIQPATPEDLAETAELVKALDRRIVAREADVRDFDALKAAVGRGVDQLGRLDIVVRQRGHRQRRPDAGQDSTRRPGRT